MNGGTDRSNRKRILAAIILTLSGAAIIASYGSSGLSSGPLSMVIGVPLLVVGVLALMRKPDRAGLIHSETAFIPSDDAQVMTDSDQVQIAAGDEVETAYLLLKSAGIPASLNSSHRSIQFPNWTHPGEAGDLLMVPRSALMQARELLYSQVSDADLIAQAEAAAPPESIPKTRTRKSK